METTVHYHFKRAQRVLKQLGYTLTKSRIGTEYWPDEFRVTVAGQEPNTRNTFFTDDLDEAVAVASVRSWEAMRVEYLEAMHVEYLGRSQTGTQRYAVNNGEAVVTVSGPRVPFYQCTCSAKRGTCAHVRAVTWQRVNKLAHEARVIL